MRRKNIVRDPLTDLIVALKSGSNMCGLLLGAVPKISNRNAHLCVSLHFFEHTAVMLFLPLSLRLVNSVVHHHWSPPPHHPLRYLLLPVLPSEMLLLCSLSLLPTAVLLPWKRYQHFCAIHMGIFLNWYFCFLIWKEICSHWAWPVGGNRHNTREEQVSLSCQVNFIYKA